MRACMINWGVWCVCVCVWGGGGGQISKETWQTSCDYIWQINGSCTKSAKQVKSSLTVKYPIQNLPKHPIQWTPLHERTEL